VIKLPYSQNGTGVYRWIARSNLLGVAVEGDEWRYDTT